MSSTPLTDATKKMTTYQESESISCFSFFSSGCLHCCKPGFSESFPWLRSCTLHLRQDPTQRSHDINIHTCSEPPSASAYRKGWLKKENDNSSCATNVHVNTWMQHQTAAITRLPCSWPPYTESWTQLLPYILRCICALTRMHTHTHRQTRQTGIRQRHTQSV